MAKTDAKLPGLEDIPNVLNIAQACQATRLGDYAIREAIKRRELPAFMPGNGKGGRGLGWRIHKADLEEWFFGKRPVEHDAPAGAGDDVEAYRG